VSEIKVNNKPVNPADAEAALESLKKITQVSLEIENKNKGPVVLTHEGIEFDKEYFSSLSQMMTKCRAQVSTTRFNGVPGMMNRNIKIIISNPGVEVVVWSNEPGEGIFKKLLFRLLMRFTE
jgi:hypothetical protein